MFLCSRHEFFSVRSRCSLQGTRHSNALSHKYRYCPWAWQGDWGAAEHHLYIRVFYNVGARTEIWGIPSSIFIGVEKLSSTKTKFSFSQERRKKKKKIVIMTICTYIRSECHGVSKAFTISKNTVSRDPPGSSYCNLLESKNDLHLIRFSPYSVFGLFLKSASQIICLWWTRSLSDVTQGTLLVFSGVWQIYDFYFKGCNFLDVIGPELNMRSAVASRASTWALTFRLWSQTHRSCALSWFSMSSAIMLALSIG
jgi:hypothetical protein